MTHQELIKYTEETNEKFLNATKAEKRIMLAEDVIKWLDSGAMDTEYSGMLHFNNDVQDVESIKDIIQSDAFSCSVCAKGALFISTINRVNNMNINVFVDDVSHHTKGIRKLKKYFTDRQLVMIEWAFEGSQVITSVGDKIFEFSNKLDDKLESYWSNFNTGVYLDYYYGDLRPVVLRGIMQNIIDNKGTFIP